MPQRLKNHFSPSLVISLVALFIALSGAGFAATGGNFILGGANTADRGSSLSAPAAGKTLQLTNTNAAAGATALGLTVAPGHAPFTVNSARKVGSLNADLLDGRDSAAFVQGPGKVGGQTGSVPSGNILAIGPPLLGAMTLSYHCPSDIGATGFLTFSNATNDGVNFFIESGTDNPTFFIMTPFGSNIGTEYTIPAASGGDSFFVNARGVFGLMTIHVATRHNGYSNACDVQALALRAG